MKTRKLHLSLLFLFIFLCLLSCEIQVGTGDKAWNDFVVSYSKIVDMGNYKLHYIDIGKGEPIVLVHGFADSTYCWHNNIHDLLSSGFRLIIVDQPGMGKSEMPPNPYVYTIENQSKEIVKLTEKLSLTKFSLIGHSMGGGIVLYISYSYPQKVKSTIAIDPVCFHPPKRLFLTYPGTTYFASIFAGRWMVKKALEQVYFNDGKVSDQLIDEYARPMNKPSYWEMLSSLSRQYFSQEFDKMIESYDKINIPLLIIWGAQDEWIPADWGLQLHKKIQSSELEIIDKCGHNSHQECSPIINSIILRCYQNLKTDN